MFVPYLSKAQTFTGMAAEQKAQNTPEGWTDVELPQLPEITSENTLNIKDPEPLHPQKTTQKLSRKLLMQSLLMAVWS